MRLSRVLLIAPFLTVLICCQDPSEILAASRSTVVAPVINIKASYPQTASAELGVAILIESSPPYASGPFLSYEPGINGQKLHLGYSFGSFDGAVALGSLDLKWFNSRVSLCFYKPWSEAYGFNKNENFYGVEAVVSYNLLLLSGGLYYDPDAKEAIGTIGVGVGW